MSDLPNTVEIDKEGPREGFQFEKQLIPTACKIELIEVLGGTGLPSIQAVSFVHPERVPGWADADQVVDGLRPRPRATRRARISQLTLEAKSRCAEVG